MQKTSTYFFKSNYKKSEKCNPTFRQGNFFPFSLNIDNSVSTQRFFSKKGKNKSWIVDICNGGIKDFVKLWEIENHLKI